MSFFPYPNVEGYRRAVLADYRRAIRHIAKVFGLSTLQAKEIVRLKQ